MSTELNTICQFSKGKGFPVQRWLKKNFFDVLMNEEFKKDLSYSYQSCA